MALQPLSLEISLRVASVYLTLAPVSTLGSGTLGAVCETEKVRRDHSFTREVDEDNLQL
jgi:hypothetical protein